MTLQTQDLQPNFVKKGENSDASIEAELELLKLQQAHAKLNGSAPQGANILSHNVLHNLLSYSDKPKRDSPMVNDTESETLNVTDEGQKELVFGHVNVDPVIYDTDSQYNQDVLTESETKKSNDDKNKPQINEQNNVSHINNTDVDNSDSTEKVLKKDADNTKLNPEIDYSDIGEAIKLISRYAEVSTDDNFTKDDKKLPPLEDSILGTRTKLQYRRNKPKGADKKTTDTSSDVTKEANNNNNLYPKNIIYYRYPWPSDNSESSRTNYPFKHLQDYWPGRTQTGGVYAHENPRRHHHSYPQYFHPRSYNIEGYAETRSGQEIYPGLRRYSHNIANRASPIKPHANNQDLYSLLGLRHWFSSEGASKR